MVKLTNMAAIGTAAALVAGAGLIAQAPAAQAATAQHVRQLTSELLTAKDPSAIWKKMSTTERDQVSLELNGATSTVGLVGGIPKVSPQTAFARCWTRAGEATYYGGFTHAKMFGGRTDDAGLRAKRKNNQGCCP